MTPIFFFHLHKCGGTTFIKAAAANGHWFAPPGHAEMPLVSEQWTAVVQPFWKETQIWHFWEERDPTLVHKCLAQMLAAGVTCLVQEYGHYDAQYWRQFTRVLCIRHPIDRLYSDFLHTQEIGKIVAGVAFHEWVEAGCAGLSTRLFVEQLGRGSVERARAALEDFAVIVVQERYAETSARMRVHGWTSTDPEKHFQSWTARQATTGRQALAAHPRVAMDLEVCCAGDLQVYYRAVELALQGAGAPPPRGESRGGGAPPP